MKGTGRDWGVALAATLLLHYAWEMLQAPWFDVFAGQSFWEHARPCLRAALGDLAIAVGAYVVTAILFRRTQWPFQTHWFWPSVAWIILGLVATVAFEKWALSVGRWHYTDAMPTIAGIGVAPLLQWIIVPAATLAIVRLAVVRPGSMSSPKMI